jgi:transglutaminase-like putative cysteine protease
MHEDCLGPTPFIESDHAAIVRFAEEATAGATTDRERAVRLFYAVRDGVRYDPYTFCLDPVVYRSTTPLARGASFCVPKSALLAAAARAVGIPSRIHIADVRNHLAPEGFRERLGTDLSFGHGFNDLWIDGRWLKVTTAFNRSLCEKLGVPPLEFDGTEDAILQPFDGEGRRFMEYILDRGSFPEMPFEELVSVYREHYSEYLDSL